MPKRNNQPKSAKATKSKTIRSTALLEPKEANKKHPVYHQLTKNFICDTESPGLSTPSGKSLSELVLDSSQGFIPLWDKNVTLRWRIQPRSLSETSDPVKIRKKLIDLFGSALEMWGTAVPVRFKEDQEQWDFEFVIKPSDQCNSHGCVLASAFFPDSGRHVLNVYPKMFSQNTKEQIDTFAHETGHIFGLRHFFAKLNETAWPSEIYGEHNKFSIMNYGDLSEMTTDDRHDLNRLYQEVWTGKLTSINGTPIKLVKPFSMTAI
jgi:hypothetical protein